MLYDPKWQKTEVQHPSRAGFIAWLETQDPTATYEFYLCDGRCLIGQYMASVGAQWGLGLYCGFAVAIGGPSLASDQPHTFGAALERARAVAP